MALSTRTYPIHVASSEREILAGRITIGAAGAVASTAGLPGVYVANSGTGLFTFQYCKDPTSATTAAATALGLPDWGVTFGLKSAAATVTETIITAESVTAGTMTIRTSKAGTAVNPASGDVIFLTINAKKYGSY